MTLMNFVASVLEKNPNLSQRANDFINNQTNWLQQQCSSVSQNDSYWNVVCSLIQQLSGLYDGYTSGIQGDGTPEKLLDFAHFYYLTNMGDLEDIVPAFNNTESYALKGRKPENGDCTIIVKLIEDDLVAAHNTHNMYTHISHSNSF